MRSRNGKPSKKEITEQGPKESDVLTKQPPESTSGRSARNVVRFVAARKKFLRVHRNGSGRP